MKNELLAAYVFSLLAILGMTSTVFAVEASRQPSPGGVSAQPAKVRKLPAVIRIDATLFPNANKELTPGFYDMWKQVTDNYNIMSNKIAAFEQQAKIYQKKRQECIDRNYTQADQKNAGCVDSDTLADCGTKLYKNCEKAEYEKYANLKKDMANAIKKIDEAAGTLNQYFTYY
jgi:hypothetical protein